MLQVQSSPKHRHIVGSVLLPPLRLGSVYMKCILLYLTLTLTPAVAQASSFIQGWCFAGPSACLICLVWHCLTRRCHQPERASITPYDITKSRNASVWTRSWKDELRKTQRIGLASFLGRLRWPMHTQRSSICYWWKRLVKQQESSLHEPVFLGLISKTDLSCSSMQIDRHSCKMCTN